ncbi:MgtC/SapB family protein [Shewanella surugensis]|uniref:Protein MgtC n=1 Tax=Shewanella surugensis TaxID=212020 RepID=A0ABT0L9T1_9GAMM|nr:MgtC/SapB family protein [Shewanella surugensis]MCL1124473.1 MgtC/SapB family protein [Shewanella surugensis]
MPAVSSELQNLTPVFDMIEVIYLFKIAVASILGGIIGFSVRKTHPNGIRIFGITALSACGFSEIAIHLYYIYQVDYTFNIIAGVVTGIGFLGAGLIFQDRNNAVRGISAAATLWAAAVIGMAIGINMYIIGFGMTVIVFLSYLFSGSEHKTQTASIAAIDDNATAFPHSVPLDKIEKINKQPQ